MIFIIGLIELLNYTIKSIQATEALVDAYLKSELV